MVALPEMFEKRLRTLCGNERVYTRVRRAYEHPLPVSFRVNTLRANPANTSSALSAAGYTVHRVPWYEHAGYISDISARELSVHTSVKGGAVFLQSLSSMLPPLVLSARSGEKVLDMAAAPGGKTSHISSLMDNTGEIVANDIDRIRRYKLRSVLNLLGVQNAIITGMPGQSVWERYPEYFDKVLLDAPCSMEGQWQKDENKTREWSYKKIKRMSSLQKWLLRSAVSATKPGGIIVYSTCTTAPEENESVIQWLLEKEHGSVVLEDIVFADAPVTPGLSSWNGISFDTTMVRTKRILPSLIMEGFFLAKLRKIRSTV